LTVRCAGQAPRLPRLNDAEIPLPPLEVQKEIVAEIEGYQNEVKRSATCFRAGSAFDDLGRLTYAARVGLFRLFYLIGKTGCPTFTELLADSENDD
jgi:hypothetical protein